MICPKKLGIRTAEKYEVKSVPQAAGQEPSRAWMLEFSEVEDIAKDHQLLARIVIAKVPKPLKVQETLLKVPIEQKAEVDDLDDELACAFTCVAWVSLALAKLRDARLVYYLDPSWDALRGRAVRYVESLKLAGQIEWTGQHVVVSYDMLNDSEVYA
ncbi:MAG: hypothetical protein M1820_000891 [Bogoriella megaspora]|nr:MAG: hypothetical protein M1820_000891 [Bogoriella megaspora]